VQATLLRKVDAITIALQLFALALLAAFALESALHGFMMAYCVPGSRRHFDLWLSKCRVCKNVHYVCVCVCVYVCVCVRVYAYMCQSILMHLPYAALGVHTAIKWTFRYVRVFGVALAALLFAPHFKVKCY